MRNEWLDRKKEREEEHNIEQIKADLRAELRASMEVEFNEKLTEAYEILSHERDEGIKKAKAEMEAVYESKLAQVQSAFQEEMAAAERVAETGYAQAYEIITQLRNRLEDKGLDSSFPVPASTDPAVGIYNPEIAGLTAARQVILELQAKLDRQRQEMEQQMESGFEEAYQMLQQERQKNQTLEVQLYEEYDDKLKDIKEYIVTKVDQFLRIKWEELTAAGDDRQAALLQSWRDAVPAAYLVESAINDRNDMATLVYEGKDIKPETTKPADERNDKIAELKAQMRILEAKNIRLNTQVKRLEEQVRQTSQIMVEQGESIKKEREELGLPPKPIMKEALKGGLLGQMKSVRASGPPIAEKAVPQARPNIQDEWWPVAEPYDGPNNQRSDEQ